MKHMNKSSLQKKKGGRIEKDKKDERKKETTEI